MVGISPYIQIFHDETSGTKLHSLVLELFFCWKSMCCVDMDRVRSHSGFELVMACEVLRKEFLEDLPVVTEQLTSKKQDRRQR